MKSDTKTDSYTRGRAMPQQTNCVCSDSYVGAFIT